MSSISRACSKALLKGSTPRYYNGSRPGSKIKAPNNGLDINFLQTSGAELKSSKVSQLCVAALEYQGVCEAME